MEIGAQFFTLRDFTKTPEDLSETLKKVADIGYKNVQLSGTCEYDPEWMREQLKANDLKCVVTHTGEPKLTDDEKLKEAIRAHEIIGCENIGLAVYDFNPEVEGHNYAKYVETFKPVAKKIKDAGKYLMFHNHHRELQWVDGKPILLKMAEDFAPDELGMLIDTFWIQAGGGDPAQYLEMLSGRVPCIHLKDLAYDRRTSVLGEGNMNFDRIFEKAETAGVQYMLVEQDECYGENPFDCLKRSYDYLTARGFR